MVKLGKFEILKIETKLAPYIGFGEAGLHKTSITFKYKGLAGTGRLPSLVTMIKMESMKLKDTKEDNVKILVLREKFEMSRKDLELLLDFAVFSLQEDKQTQAGSKMLLNAKVGKT